MLFWLQFGPFGCLWAPLIGGRVQFEDLSGYKAIFSAAVALPGHNEIYVGYTDVFAAPTWLIELDDDDGYLLRGDKVELPPGGVAYDTHTPVVAYVAWCRGGSSLRRAELSTATSNTNPGSKPDPIRFWPGHRNPNLATSPAS